MTEAMIWRRKAGKAAPRASRRSLQRSMQERTWDRDLEPTKQIDVTKTSVEARLGSGNPESRACCSTDSKIAAISESGAFRRIKPAISLPSAKKGADSSLYLKSGVSFSFSIEISACKGSGS